MTFDFRELSLFGGEPIGLIRFTRGALVWRYATGDRPQTIGSGPTLETFDAPGGVSRSAIQDSSQRAKNRLTITLPADLPVASNWLPHPTSGRVIVECLTLHRGDAEFHVEWTGRVLAPKFYDTKIELVCEPSRSVTKSRGNNLRWQRGCPLTLYSQGIGMCNVNPETRKILATLTAATGLSLTAAAFGTLPDGRLRGGFIRWTRPDGEPDYRTIMDHAGTVIFVDYASDQLPIGTVISTYSGCAHDWLDCGYFANQPNYGGARYIPVKTPHDGNPVQ